MGLAGDDCHCGRRHDRRRDGESSDEKTRPGPDLTALKCPMVETASAGGAERYKPAKNAFDSGSS
jgi:hypothetical protein